MSLSDFDPHTWHPVRIPAGSSRLLRWWHGGRPGASDDELSALSDWCRLHCVSTWLPVNGDNGAVFWFEDDADARAFALQWFPLRNW